MLEWRSRSRVARDGAEELMADGRPERDLPAGLPVAFCQGDGPWAGGVVACR